MAKAKAKASILTKLIFVCGLWVLINIFAIIFIWSKSYFVDYGAIPATYYLDKRSDLSKPGHIITIVATHAEPSKYWFFGHMWVAFDTTPPNEPMGTHQYGYYSQNKEKAAIELVKSIFNPVGFYFGQTPVKGQIQIDDPWRHHLELKIQVNDDVYQSAIAEHEKWRTQEVYINRPKWGGKSYACQDYVYGIAGAIGLKTPKTSFGEFPPESFVKFAALNGVDVVHRPSIKNLLK